MAEEETVQHCFDPVSSGGNTCASLNDITLRSKLNSLLIVNMLLVNFNIW